MFRLTWIKRALRAPRHTALRMLDQRKLEETAHLQLLRGLARNLGIPEDAADATYVREVTTLRASASVQRYVSLIAEKRAKNALRKEAGRRPAR
jgi:hypothetical protein